VDLKVWGVPLAGTPFPGRRRPRRLPLRRRDKRLETRCNLLITRAPLLLHKLILLNRLLQRKEMLRTPVTFQGLGERGLIVCAARIPVGG
jgi:hypothetical protein